jgi:hypothetical protein
MAIYTKSPGTVVNTESLLGSNDWFEPNNVKVNDNAFSTCSPSLGLQGFYISSYLDCTNFGFQIPIGATINGVTVTIERCKDGVGPGYDVLDHAIYLFDGTDNIGDNKSTGASWATCGGKSPPPPVTFGGPADLWGATLTPSLVNSTGFGVRIACQGIAGDIDGYGGGGIEEAYIDHVEMSVFYTGSNIKYGTVATAKIFFGDTPIRKVKFGNTDIF